MKIDSHFSKLLISLLHKYGKIELDQIVRYELNQVGSVFAESNEILSAPSVTLVVSKPEGYDLLTEILERNEGLEATALEEIRKKVERMRSDWQDTGHLVFSEFGDLYRVENALQWVASVHEPFNPSTYLDQVVLDRIPPKKVIDSDYVKDYTRTSLKGQRIIEDTSVDSIKNYAIPLLIFLSGIVLTVLAFQYFMKSNGTNQQDTVTLGARAADDPDPILSIDTNPIFENKLIQKYKDILTQDIIESGCKIVVGSFEGEVNARQMLVELSDEGYDAEVMPSDEGYRVIIIFDCANRDLVDYLSEIKIKITEKAWLIAPKYDPFNQ